MSFKYEFNQCIIHFFDLKHKLQKRTICYNIDTFYKLMQMIKYFNWKFQRIIT